MTHDLVAELRRQDPNQTTALSVAADEIEHQAATIAALTNERDYAVTIAAKACEWLAAGSVGGKTPNDYNEMVEAALTEDTTP